jgi:O-antigen ligase
VTDADVDSRVRHVTTRSSGQRPAEPDVSRHMPRSAKKTVRGVPLGAGIATAGAIGYVAALPLLRPSGPFNTSPVDAAGLVVVVAILVASRTARVRIRLPYAVPVALFALAGTLGAVAGPVPALGLTAVAQDLILLAVCGALSTTARFGDVRRILLRTWAIAALFWAVLLIVGVVFHISAFAGGGTRYGARASLTTGDPNLAANYFVVSLFMLYAARWPAKRLYRWLVTVVLVVAVLLTGSNGATVALLVGALVAAIAVLCKRQGWPLLGGLVAIGALAGFVAAVVPISHWQQNIVAAARASSIPIVRDSVGRENQSSSTRHTLLDESVALFRADGVLGRGPGSTKYLLESRQFPYQKEAHDDYLAALTERGSLGVLGLALLISVIAAKIAALRRQTGGADRRPIPSAPVIGCAVAIATSGLFYEVLHFRQVWVFLALLASALPERRS